MLLRAQIEQQEALKRIAEQQEQLDIKLKSSKQIDVSPERIDIESISEGGHNVESPSPSYADTQTHPHREISISLSPSQQQTPMGHSVQHRPSTPSVIPGGDPFEATAAGQAQLIRDAIATPDEVKSVVDAEYSVPTLKSPLVIDPAIMKTNETAVTQTTNVNRGSKDEETANATSNVDTSVIESFRGLLARKDKAARDDDGSSVNTETLRSELAISKDQPIVTITSKEADKARPKVSSPLTTTETKVTGSTTSPKVKPLVPSQIITSSTIVNAAVDEFVEGQSGKKTAGDGQKHSVKDKVPSSDPKFLARQSQRHASASTADHSTVATEIEYADMLELNDTLDSPAAAEIGLGLAGVTSSSTLRRAMDPRHNDSNRLQIAQPFTPTTHTGFVPEGSSSSNAYRSPATQSSSPNRDTHNIMANTGKDQQPLSRFPQEEDATIIKSRRDGSSSLDRQNSNSYGNAMVTILSTLSDRDQKGLKTDRGRKRADSQHTTASKSINVVNTTHNTTTTVLSHNATPFDVVVMPDGTRRLQFRQGSVINRKGKGPKRADSSSSSGSSSDTSSDSSSHTHHSSRSAQGNIDDDPNPKLSSMDEPSSRSPIGSFRPPLRPAANSIMRKEDAFGSINNERRSREDSPTKRSKSLEADSRFRRALRAPSADGIGNDASPNARQLQEPMNKQPQDLPVSRSRGPGGRATSTSRERDTSPAAKHHNRQAALRPPSRSEDGERQIKKQEILRAMAPIGGSHMDPYLPTKESKDSYVEDDDDDDGDADYIAPHDRNDPLKLNALPQIARDWISMLESDRIAVEGGLRTLVAMLCAQRDEMLSYCSLRMKKTVSHNKKLSPATAPLLDEEGLQLPPSDELMDCHFALVDVAAKLLSSHNQQHFSDPTTAIALSYQHTLVERERCLSLLNQTGMLRSMAEGYSPSSLSDLVAAAAVAAMEGKHAEKDKTKLIRKVRKEAKTSIILWQLDAFGMKWVDDESGEGKSEHRQGGRYDVVIAGKTTTPPRHTTASPELVSSRQELVLPLLEAIADGKSGLRYLAACVAQEREDLLMRFVEQS
eukprot:GILI01019555.1.p1 GENE.GILI01019555.1~~GILI01019555.1.p1  ORF type:complete len:1170 (-),score=219.30 GILI01019555.1:86-3268(-)